MRKTELIEMAKELGVKGYSKMTKAELEIAIENAKENNMNREAEMNKKLDEIVGNKACEIIESQTGYKAEFREVEKNGIKKSAIMVHTDTNIAATIYANFNATPEDIADEVMNVLKNSPKTSEELGFDINEMSSLDYVKENVYPLVIGNQPNNIAYTEFLDMYVVYKVKLHGNENPDYVTQYSVTNDLLERLGITVEELHQIAINNIDESDFEYPTIEETLSAMMGGECPIPFPEENKMLVASNRSKHFGGNVILCPNTLNKIMKKLGVASMYILPSSIHEILCVRPEGDVWEKKRLDQMVHEVNTNEVAPEEIMGHHSYFWNGEVLA